MPQQRSPITCHILDTVKGKPAYDVSCELYRLYGASANEVHMATQRTDADGRISNWSISETASGKLEECGVDDEGNWQILKPGIYKIQFKTGTYFQKVQDGSNRVFFPYVDVVFEIQNVKEHYHIPLLLSNNSYTTYRGS